MVWRDRAVEGINASYGRDLQERTVVVPRRPPSHPRLLTPRECCRLQGFPESFKIDDSPYGWGYSLLGNAVSTPVIAALGGAIMCCLEHGGNYGQRGDVSAVRGAAAAGVPLGYDTAAGGGGDGEGSGGGAVEGGRRHCQLPGVGAALRLMLAAMPSEKCEEVRERAVVVALGAPNLGSGLEDARSEQDDGEEAGAEAEGEVVTCLVGALADALA